MNHDIINNLYNFFYLTQSRHAARDRRVESEPGNMQQSNASDGGGLHECSAQHRTGKHTAAGRPRQTARSVRQVSRREYVNSQHGLCLQLSCYKCLKLKNIILFLFTYIAADSIKMAAVSTGCLKVTRSCNDSIITSRPISCLSWVFFIYSLVKNSK